MITWKDTMKVNKIYRVLDSCNTKEQRWNAINWIFGKLELDRFCKDAFFNYLQIVWKH